MTNTHVAQVEERPAKWALPPYKPESAGSSPAVGGYE